MLLAAVCLAAQGAPDQPQPSTSQPTPQLQPAAAAGAQPSGPADLPGADDVISYLNQTMNWHHRLAADQQLASDPVDVIYLDDDRQLADQILRLSFDFARAEAQLVEQEHPEQQQAQPQSQYQALTSAAAEADNEVKQRQAQLADLKRKLATARGRARADLQSQIDAMQSEIELEQTRSQTLHSILQFVGGKEAAARSGNLAAQVEELRRSVPELQSDTTKSGQATAAAATGAAAAEATNRRVQPSGIVNLVSDLLALNRKSRTLQQTRHATDALANSEDALRKPLLDQLTALARQSDTVLEQGGEASAEARGSMDELASRFKQISAAVLPLEKQAILFDAYRNNLDRWRSAVRDQESEDLRALAVRAIALAIIVGFVLILAEIWRKAIFRYVHDTRRRYQFLLLRRILLWIAIAIAVAFGLASEIGSLATFVGLITAGIAVALQSVIMAIAGYFFLIGRYGVRVGDRVQIAGVTGDVLDIGLVRTHLMEVASTGAGQQPTGRVVVLSNATVFQPGASLFKQIPGTNFVWHEVTLTLAPESDYGEVEKRMLAAVEAVYAKYRERLEAQHRSIEERLNVNVGALRPQSRLRLTQTGLEIIIRYPVEVEHAAEVDDDVARELLNAIQKTPRLKLVPGGTPNIQRVPDPEAKAG